jgi:hypothetical protein
VKLFSLSAQETSLHAFLAFKVSVEEICCDFDGFTFVYYFFFSLIAFDILSLFSVFVVLMIIYCGVLLFWLSLFGVLEASCT